MKNHGMHQGYATYKRVGLETASGPQLLLALYDGSIRFVGLAKAGMERGDHEATHRNLVRAQEIIAEFLSTLDMKYGTLPEQLMDLYIYLYRTLAEANVEKNVGKAQEVERILRKLREAWREAIQQIGKQQATAPTAEATA